MALTVDGGAVTFVGGGRFGTAPGAFPTTVDGGPVNRYAAGTFQFTAAVPEPGSFAFAGVGVVCLAAFGRRRWRGGGAADVDRPD